jgi:hypothetical protein
MKKMMNKETEDKIRKTVGKLLDELDDSLIAQCMFEITDTMTQIAVYYNFTEGMIKTIIEDGLENGIKVSNIRNFEKKINNNDLFRAGAKND